MNARRWIALTMVAGTIALIGWWRSQPPGTRPSEGGQLAETSTTKATDRGERETQRDRLPLPAVPDPVDASFHQALAILAATLGNDVEGARQAAAELRRLLRTDGDAREEAFEQLLTGTMDDSLRGALILVLGTLPVPDVDPVLVKALDKFSNNPDLVVHLLHALGASREPADLDDIFDMGSDQPWGVDGPGGLGITIRRRIEDAALAQVIGAYLFLRDDEGIRRAAATTLRHSLELDLARDSFRSALQGEISDGVSMILGEGLAVWAGGTADVRERTAVVDTLLSRADTPDFDGYRFQMENDFQRIPLTSEQGAHLQGYLTPGQSFAMRSWAAMVLVSMGRQEARITNKLRERLNDMVLGDSDVAMRDLSARLLRNLPPSEATMRALVIALATDAAWNVRFTAAETLAKFGPRPEVLAALRSATRDSDERVAQKARELLERMFR